MAEAFWRLSRRRRFLRRACSAVFVLQMRWRLSSECFETRGLPFIIIIIILKMAISCNVLILQSDLICMV